MAVVPATRPEMFDVLCKAVEDAGATLSPPETAEGLVWADPSAADLFPEISKNAPRLEWIQLPYAGIEPFEKMYFLLNCESKKAIGHGTGFELLTFEASCAFPSQV